MSGAAPIPHDREETMEQSNYGQRERERDFQSNQRDIERARIEGIHSAKLASLEQGQRDQTDRIEKVDRSVDALCDKVEAGFTKVDEKFDKMLWWLIGVLLMAAGSLGMTIVKLILESKH
jgi:hypothetical protein